jgi:hypothetical protein
LVVPTFRKSKAATTTASRPCRPARTAASTGGGSTCGTTPSTCFRRTPAAPLRSRKGTGRTTPPTQSKRRCSSPTGLCSGVIGTPGSPWRGVVGQYHARGVAPLRRRLLQLCDMTADRAPWVRTETAPELPLPLEVQRRVVIGRATYSWLPSRMLPMLPNAGTEKFVSCPSSRPISIIL